MKNQEKRAEQKRPPILDKETAERLALWIEGEDKPIFGERYLKYIDRAAAAIIIACLIVLAILAIDYFLNQNIA